MDKLQLRRSIRERKRAMTEEEIVSRSQKLAELFLASDAYKNATTIYGYLPYNQEGKKVAVPKCYGSEMEFIYLDDLTKVEKGYSNIPEPIEDGPIARDKSALVLMPGLAFDPQGHRIGYGGGFYDKYLSAEPGHPTLALCYEFQMLPHLETEEHDIPVDTVLWA